MLAPEPFFEPRGTPFSEYHRLKALTELGHHVDLVTYPFGADVEMPNLRIIRCGRPPLIRGVRTAPATRPLGAAPRASHRVRHISLRPTRAIISMNERE